jgi:hypothetical protein
VRKVCPEVKKMYTLCKAKLLSKGWPWASSNTPGNRQMDIRYRDQRSQNSIQVFTPGSDIPSKQCQKDALWKSKQCTVFLSGKKLGGINTI